VTNSLSFGPTTWPEAITLIAVLAVVVFLIGVTGAAFFEARKLKMTAHRDEDLRQLVHRFEQLAENLMDAQQRVATDLAELRARAASIEQILRTVE
jgi:Tfp pilus assembly protein PilV